MKRLGLFMTVIMILCITVNAQKQSNRTLVAYFSATGTTEKAAKQIAEVTGGALYEIQPAKKYTSADLDWHDKSSRSSVEMADASSRPALRSQPQNLAAYDTIYIGFPIWWNLAPRIINSFIYPQPVFIIAAYDENGLPNAMNAAWGGISEMNEISICISEGHKTTANILKRKAFTVSMAEAGQIIACDYVGIVSGNKVPDKFVRAGFHATRSEFVDAPLIDELSVAVECKLKDYNPETCILRGEIVNVSVDERVLDQNGKVDASKVIPVIFDPFNNDYLKVGEKVGNAFSDGKALK